MGHRALSATLAALGSVSLLISGCAAKKPPAPPSFLPTQQDLSILKSALALSSKQPYTQIEVSGTSSTGNALDTSSTLPSDIKQTINVDGTTVQVNQDYAPSIYETTNDLYFAVAGRWRKFTANNPSPSVGAETSVLSNVTPSNLHSKFQLFSAKQMGANQLLFTMVPANTYRAQFLDSVSKALHRVMVDQDPYDWTMSVPGLTSGSRALQSEQVTLTLTKENGSWVPTDGVWDISYSNGPNISEIHVTESYTHKKMPISLPSDAMDGGTVKLSPAATHPDGQIISLTPINALNIPDFYTSLNAYKMTYWSQNTPVVAYIAVPEQAGTYPLSVSCHGGWLTPFPVTHVLTVGSGPNLLSFAPKNEITVAPMYRGYGDSDGPVSGLSEDATDTINAIKAIESKYHVEPGHVYLSGVSLGGGVVLKVATEQSGIRSVIAESPWVGANLVDTWYLSHEQSALPHVKGIYQEMVYDYGPFGTGKSIYQKQSIDYMKITAPTLLLQGTGDQVAQWQTVQTLYQDMKAAHKPVQFDLVQGADHGFTGPYASYAHSAISLWYGKYGEEAP